MAVFLLYFLFFSRTKTLKLKIFSLSMMDEIHKILFEMSRKNQDFPILDLTKIIVDYVYEPPDRCVKIIETKDRPNYITEVNNRIITGSAIGNIEMNENQIKIQQFVDTVIGLKDGNILTLSAISAVILIWDSITEKNIAMQKITNNSPKNATELKDGCIASAWIDGTINIWNWKKNYSSNIYRDKHSWDTNIIELKDGCIACASESGNIKILNRSGQCLINGWVQAPHTTLIYITELQNGLFACKFSNRDIKLWDRLTQKTHIFPNYSLNPITFKHMADCYSIHPIIPILELKDSTIAFTRNKRTIEIWDIKTKKCVKILRHNARDNICSMALLKDGSIAVGMYDNTIEVYR